MTGVQTCALPISDIETFKDSSKLNTEDKINKGTKDIETKKAEHDADSRAGKALEATSSGVGDIGKGLSNLDELTKWNTPGSDGTQEIKNSQNNLNKNLDKLLNNNPTTNQTSNSNQISELKTQLEYLKDDINDLTYTATPQINQKQGVLKK